MTNERKDAKYLKLSNNIIYLKAFKPVKQPKIAHLDEILPHFIL